MFSHVPSLQSNLEQTATAFWSVLLKRQYPIMADVIDYINVGCLIELTTNDSAHDLDFQEKGSYKGANKDLWNMVSLVGTFEIVIEADVSRCLSFVKRWTLAWRIMKPMR